MKLVCSVRTAVQIALWAAILGLLIGFGLACTTVLR
jgi:ABC-type uncharacterized transport system permease subunit